jgi:hypothetical protein
VLGDDLTAREKHEGLLVSVSAVSYEPRIVAADCSRNPRYTTRDATRDTQHEIGAPPFVYRVPSLVSREGLLSEAIRSEALLA